MLEGSLALHVILFSWPAGTAPALQFVPKVTK